MASSVTVMSRFSYPKVPGDQPWSVVDVTGPASYVAVLPAAAPPPPADEEGTLPSAAPSGGQTVTAADFGLQSIDWVGAMGSDDGSYNVSVLPGDFSSGSPLDSVVLLWIDAATGLEVTAGTDLSASTVRLLAIGR